jgi:hypothetical protein
MLLVALPAQILIAEEIDPRKLLSEMSSEISGLDSFQIDSDAYTDARMDAGLVIQHAAQITLKIDKPGKLHVTNRDSVNSKEILFSDGLLSVFSTEGNFYAQKKIPAKLDSAMDFMVNQMAIEAPLLDFVFHNLEEHLLEDAREVSYMGTSLIRNKVFHHVVVRTSESDLQLWIAANAPILPGKIIITSKWEAGSPRFVGFLNWQLNPEFSDQLGTFTPPDGATSIDFVTDQ